VPDPTGFLRHERRTPARRPVPVRLGDWREVYEDAGEPLIREQAERCMDCGVPFCHHACPLGNRIPDWNDLVRTGAWAAAADALHATNNFPEFTGRLCPAPCEAACVLAIPGGPGAVTIKQVEVEIANRAYVAGLPPARPAPNTDRRVAVIGSGPAGLAAAQQLTRAGHAVTVFERDGALGGLLRYGIPDFKLEKRWIDGRLEQLCAEGIQFRTGICVGVDLSVAELRAGFDAVLLATGALTGRDVPAAPGRELAGVHLAMTHLVAANRANRADRAVADRPSVAGGPDVTADGKHVVIIGGGDTAADCLGVAHRQRAASVVQLDLYPNPPGERDESRDPWPTWPWVLRTYPAHEEGGARRFAVTVQSFVDDGCGAVRAVRIADATVSHVDRARVITPHPGTERELAADLVLLAIGFDGTEPGPLLDGLGLIRNARGTLDCGPDWQTAVPGVFVAGDAHRGASLVVWAIAEGRSAAAAIDTYLGGTTRLPAPVTPTDMPLTA
jgi:glutamate synthase (NADPH) small chain